MFDFHEKRKIRNVLYSKAVIFLLFSFTILMSFSVYNRYTVAGDMRKKLEDKRFELEEMKLRAQTLDAKVQYLENERGVEEELRNRFDVVKEGEQVVILLDRKDTKKYENSIEIKSKSSQSNEESKKTFFDSLKFWQE